MVWAKIVVLVVFASLCYSEVIHVQKCLLKRGVTPTCSIENVQANPCKEAAENQPCRFKKGDNATLTFDFTPKFAVGEGQLKSLAYKVKSFVDAPFLDMDSDGCKYTKCPIAANTKQSYQYTLQLRNSYPIGLHQVKWMLWDSNDHNNKCCFTFSINIMS